MISAAAAGGVTGSAATSSPSSLSGSPRSVRGSWATTSSVSAAPAARKRRELCQKVSVRSLGFLHRRVSASSAGVLSDSEVVPPSWSTCTCAQLAPRQAQTACSLAPQTRGIRRAIDTAHKPAASHHTHRQTVPAGPFDAPSDKASTAKVSPSWPSAAFTASVVSSSSCAPTDPSPTSSAAPFLETSAASP